MGVSIDTVADRPKANVVNKPVSSSDGVFRVEMNTIDLHKVIAGVIN